jgi:peptide/nickel transport system permease protein
LHKVLRMVGQRLALGLLTLLIISVIIFGSVSLLPGDPAQAILGSTATPDTVAALRHQLQLDRPPEVRYFAWLAEMAQGDFGKSIASGREVSELIDVRLANTLFLAGFAAVIAIPLALTLGVLAALWRNGIYDRLISVTTLAVISFPEFFIAYLLVSIFAVQTGLFPSLANVHADTSIWERIYRTTLPALTLTMVTTAYMMRMTRAAIINVMASPYIEMAKLKGTSPLRVILLHAMPNALSPIINVIAITLAYLVVGVVIVEVVFVYPGLGQLLIDSVSKRDLPVVQAACLIFAVTYILLNLIADVLSIISNPRLLHPR